MARQPRKERVVKQTCPKCEKDSVKRERRPGKWVWRCYNKGCTFKKEGKSWTTTSSRTA